MAIIGVCGLKRFSEYPALAYQYDNEDGGACFVLWRWGKLPRMYD